MQPVTGFQVDSVHSIVERAIRQSPLPRKCHLVPSWTGEKVDVRNLPTAFLGMGNDDLRPSPKVLRDDCRLDLGLVSRFIEELRGCHEAPGFGVVKLSLFLKSIPSRPVPEQASALLSNLSDNAAEEYWIFPVLRCIIIHHRRCMYAYECGT